MYVCSSHRLSASLRQEERWKSCGVQRSYYDERQRRCSKYQHEERRTVETEINHIWYRYLHVCMYTYSFSLSLSLSLSPSLSPFPSHSHSLSLSPSPYPFLILAATPLSPYVSSLLILWLFSSLGVFCGSTLTFIAMGTTLHLLIVTVKIILINTFVTEMLW